MLFLDQITTVAILAQIYLNAKFLLTKSGWPLNVKQEVAAARRAANGAHIKTFQFISAFIPAFNKVARIIAVCTPCPASSCRATDAAMQP
jgi:hypothetical protein